MSISFNGYFNINTNLIEQAKTTANHMHETSKTEDAMSWLGLNLTGETKKSRLLVFCFSLFTFLGMATR